MEQLNNWIFHFSPYSDEWRAVKRENYEMLFNDTQNEEVLKSKKIETIINYIIKTNN